jgi:hypothetical protein
MSVEQSVELELAGETKVLEQNAPVPFRPQQIPHDLTWDQAQPATVGSQRLTA